MKFCKRYIPFIILLSVFFSKGLFTGSAAAKPTDLTVKPEVYWSLNEGGGTAAKDSTGNVAGRELNVVGKSQWVDGKDGKGFYLDGFTVLSMNGDKQLKSLSLSISLWAKIEGFPNPGAKPEFDTHRLMTIEGIGGLAPGSVEFGFWEGVPDAGIIADKKMNKESVLGESAISPDNKWHHYALVIDDTGEKMTYYIDGVPVKEGALSRTLGLPKLLCVPAERGYSGNLNIGGWIDIDEGKTVSRGIKGAIDEIAVYYSALGVEDIKKLAGTEAKAETSSAAVSSAAAVSSYKSAGTSSVIAVSSAAVSSEAASSFPDGESDPAEISSNGVSSKADASSRITSETSGENKTGGWVVPVIIVLLALGGGAAVYYFVIRKRMNIK